MGHLRREAELSEVSIPFDIEVICPTKDEGKRLTLVNPSAGRATHSTPRECRRGSLNGFLPYTATYGGQPSSICSLE